VRLVVIMDPIEAINPAKDSTLAILIAAQTLGWQLHYAELGDIWLRDGIAFGRLAPLEVFDDPATWFRRSAPAVAKLGDHDVILMRKDPPFDTEYIYSTYILDRARQQGALVVNRPQGLRDMNEKVYTAWFPE
jgi:glutathione synthase